MQHPLRVGAPLPFSWIAALVQYAYNYRAPPFTEEVNGKWKAAHQRATHLSVYLGKLLRSAAHALQNHVHLFDEFVAEASPLRFVPVSSFFEVRLGFQAEKDRHDFRRLLREVVNLALTSSHRRTASRSAS